MKIETVRIELITPYEKNAKKHPKEQVELIANSIKEFGFKTPLVLDEDKVIIQGHGRLLASELLGLEEVPCIIATDLDKSQVNMLRLADNKVAESDWDIKLLDEELVTLLEEFDIGDFGFELEAVKNANDEEAVPDIVDTPIIKLGDRIVLGNHVIMCGDSTKEDDILKLMGGEKADLIITDPPYNVNYEGGTKDKLTIENDNMEDGAFYDFLYDSYFNMYSILRDGACIYVFHADMERVNFTKAFVDAGMKLASTLIWNKNAAVMGRGDYNWKHEPILYGWKEGAAHYYSKDFTQTTVQETTKEDLHKMKKDDLVKLAQSFIDEQVTTVIDHPKPIINAVHPTMKPVDLITKLVRHSSKAKWNVVDPFGGGGSTLISCEDAGRKSFTMEYDPKYAQVIVQRYCEYTEVNKIEINGKEVEWDEYKG